MNTPQRSVIVLGANGRFGQAAVAPLPPPAGACWRIRAVRRALPAGAQRRQPAAPPHWTAARGRRAGGGACAEPDLHALGPGGAAAGTSGHGPGAAPGRHLHAARQRLQLRHADAGAAAAGHAAAARHAPRAASACRWRPRCSSAPPRACAAWCCALATSSAVAAALARQGGAGLAGAAQAGLSRPAGRAACLGLPARPGARLRRGGLQHRPADVLRAALRRPHAHRCAAAGGTGACRRHARHRAGRRLAPRRPAVAAAARRRAGRADVARAGRDGIPVARAACAGRPHAAGQVGPLPATPLDSALRAALRQLGHGAAAAGLPPIQPPQGA